MAGWRLELTLLPCQPFQLQLQSFLRLLCYWGGPLLGVQKANVSTAPKMRLLQWPFLPNWRSFNKQQRFCKCRIPGNTVADWRFPAQSGAKEQVANLCQSTMLFGIVWVLLSQAFAAWRGWGADSAATLLVGCLFLRLPWQWIVLSRLGVALLSFVLVSWCVVCFWLPPFAPRLLTRQLCGSDCVSPGVQYHPIKE